MENKWRAVDLRHQKGGQIRIFDPQNRHVANVNAHNDDAGAIAYRIVAAMNAHDSIVPVETERKRSSLMDIQEGM